MSRPGVELVKYSFTKNIAASLQDNYFAQNLWPLIYIIEGSKTDKKIAYVGETTDVVTRMNAHLKNEFKQELDFVNIITSNKFNKSATLDLESNLIKYLSGEDSFKLLNGNLGLANHNYYQKEEVYWEIFTIIWDKLRAQGIVKKSLEHIENSDVFKYSPYKSLNNDQTQGLLKILQQFAQKKAQTIIIEGGAGTGKSILAVFLFKLLTANINDYSLKEFGVLEDEIIKYVKEIKAIYPDIKMGLVVPMASFRKTLKRIFKNIKGLKQNMVISPSEVSRNKFDLLLVDEAHRLKRRVNLTNYQAFDKSCEILGLDPKNATELDWVLLQAKSTILFYDENQSIKPTDISAEIFKSLIKHNATLKLKSQFRVKAGNDYVEFINLLLKNKLNKTSEKFHHNSYNLLLFDNLEEMIEQIKIQNDNHGLARIIAGFSWKWVSKYDSNLKDIKIGNCELTWNSVDKDWINSDNAINEVGCIHTVQGYDLNYCAIIFGNEISYDPISKKIFIKPEYYFDKNGKKSIKDPKDLKSYIINIYKTIMLRGIKGTYIYACDENLQKYFETYINKFQSKISIPDIVFLTYDIKPFINAIPFYDLRASAGSFSELQQIDEMQWVKAPDNFKINKDYFICQIVGESMNKIIPNGSYCIFSKDSGGSRNGKIVLVESSNIQDSDFGSSYTVKEYHSTKYADEDGFEHRSITLKPKSYDSSFANLELTNDELETFKVVGVFEQIITNSGSF
ncbi:MAG: DUF2075 domain-containing protein [Alphaproteobacteria bacterium]|jgi:uncharacterized protein|nr:DUF2075 domain-containing protein [Alphaproteobacteria bacterium]